MSVVLYENYDFIVYDDGYALGFSDPAYTNDCRTMRWASVVTPGTTISRRSIRRRLWPFSKRSIMEATTRFSRPAPMTLPA